MPIAALDTPRLHIREVTATDAAGFLAYMQEQAYWQSVPIDPPTPDSIAAMVAARLTEQAADPRTGYFLAATDRQSGQVIGEAILHIRSLRWRQGEIGWGVADGRTGQGLATEIGQAMLRLAFEQLHLHRVYAQCRFENQASRRVMEKLGLRQEGVLRDNVLARGAWWSSAQYAILDAEWRGGAAE
jgi:[ribosomal protein S5]-alanine N-acetyltransferase